MDDNQLDSESLESTAQSNIGNDLSRQTSLGGSRQPAFETPNSRATTFSRRKATLVSVVITAIVLLITGSTIAYLSSQDSPEVTEKNIPTQDIHLQSATPGTLADELQGAEEALLVNGDLITTGDIKVSSGGYVTILRSSLRTGDQVYSLPDETGTICLDGNNCNFVTQNQLEQLRGAIPSATPAQPGILSVSAGSSNLAITNNGGNVRISDTTANDPRVSSLNNRTGSLLLQGTANRISVSTSSGVLTLSTPQDINTGASPTFAAITVANLNASGTVTLSGSLNLSSLDCTANANGGALTTNGSGQVICSDDDGGAGSSISGSGTAGTIPVFTAAQSIADSLLSQAAGTITVNGALSVTGAATAVSFTGSHSGDGTGLTNVNAAQLNSQNGAFYQNAGNLNAGTLSNLRLNASVSLLGQTIGLSELETDSVDSAKLVNGSVANIDLVNSSLTVTAGTGLSGGGSIALGGSAALNLANTAVTIGTYGNANNVGQFTVDQQGRITSATNVPITGLDSCSTCVSLQSTTPGSPQTGHINVTGTVIAGNFSGNGASVTNVNATQLNGQAGSYYQNASNINAGTLANARLVNAGALTVTAGGGLINGGAVALGASTTLNIGAGDGITVNADDVAVDASVCRTSGNCAGVGGTGDVLQGGNSFVSTDLTVGTNNAQSLQLETNNVTRLTINTTGLLNLSAYGSGGQNCVGLGNSGKLTTDASGNVVCAADVGGAGGTVGGSGTAGALAKFTGANTIGDSIISEAGYYSYRSWYASSYCIAR